MADSGYPVEPNLLTPILNADTEAEQRYNSAHKSARNVVERCNGVLKNRFRCLIQNRTLHYSPQRACKIIYSCAILHNICRDRKIPLLLECDEEEEDDIDVNEGLIGEGDASLLAAGRRQRQQYINNNFN